MINDFSFGRVKSIIKKEFFHILRDPFTLGAALGLPIFMVIVFGMAIEFNVKDINLAVIDSDKTQSSRELIDTFGSSEYFLIHNAISDADGIRQLESETVRAALVIPPHFEKDIFSGRGGVVQMLLDGSDNSTVSPILGYIGKIQSISGNRIANFNLKLPYELKTRFLFNPELNSRWFVIPGLNVLIIGILSVLLTSLTIAREYESGSMELLLSTNMQPLEIIIGKLVPYGILAIIALSMIYVIARFAFGVPFVGSYFVFGLGAFLFLVAYLSQGLLISVTTRNQQVAMQVAMITGMLPTQLLSGFIFPIESMPQVLQYFTMILPARWFMEISRDTFLKGTNIFELFVPFLNLILFCFFIIWVSKKCFKKDLEP